MDIPQPEIEVSAPAPLHALYINLDGDEHRRRLISEQLKRAGIAGDRIGAIDGRKQLPPSVAGFFAHVTLGREPLLSPGAIGCYASHLKTWQQIAGGPDVPVLVLEDDAILDAGIAPIIKDVLEALPPEWDMVHLSQAPRHAFRPLEPLACGRTLLRYSRIPFGAAGYLMSRRGAVKMLNPAVLRYWAVDLDTRRPWVFGMDVYGVNPPPIWQDRRLSSTIGRAKQQASGVEEAPKPAYTWTNRPPRRGLPKPTTYSWTNLPLHTLSGLMFNIRKLGLAWWLRCLFVNFTLKAMRLAPRIRMLDLANHLSTRRTLRRRNVSRP
jgi:glycosyl transferase, family 25